MPTLDPVNPMAMINDSRIGSPHSSGAAAKTSISCRLSGGTVPAGGSTKYPRRKRSRNSSYQTILFMSMVAVAVIFIGIVATLKYLPTPQHLVRRPLSTISERGESESPRVESRNRRLNLTLISDSLQLTEQRILLDAKDELDKFPVSVGSDADQNNHNWEWILHPGLEALKYQHGESYTLKNSKASVSAVAAILLRKKNAKQPEGVEKTSDAGYMRVPKFWDPEPFRVIADVREQFLGNNSSKYPLENDWGVRRYLGNYGSRLMTPQEAKSIGSRIKSRNSDDHLETIFVTIASYRDWQCSATVESVFLRASHPERIRVGVVDQVHEDDTPCSTPPEGPCETFPHQATCQYKDHIDYLTIDAQLSVGPVFARHLGHRLYRGEYFALQSDAHITFVSGWDDEIVSQWHSAKNEMAVLSTYLSGVEGHIDVKTGTRTSISRPIMCESDFEGTGDYKHLRHGQQPEGIPYIHDGPTLNPFWAAGFSFGRGHFVVNVPYDQHLPWIFQGEEISMGLRGYS